MATCSRCGWALGEGATTGLCQTCAAADAALADAVLDAEVAALAQPSEDERRAQLADDFREHGLEGALAKQLLSSKDNRKILVFGAIGVLVIGIIAAVVADRLEDSEPKLSVANVVDKRRPAVKEVLSKFEVIAKHAALIEELKPPPSDARNNVVLNLSGQPGDATATILELRQMAAVEPGARFILKNPRYDGVLRMLTPEFVETADVRERIKRAQWAKYHASWIQALDYVVVARDLVVGGSGMLEGAILVYRLKTAELIGGLPLSTSAGGNVPRALHALLAEHFDVFTEHGEKVKADG